MKASSTEIGERVRLLEGLFEANPDFARQDIAIDFQSSHRGPPLCATMINWPQAEPIPLSLLEIIFRQNPEALCHESPSSADDAPHTVILEWFYNLGARHPNRDEVFKWIVDKHRTQPSPNTAPTPQWGRLLESLMVVSDEERRDELLESLLKLDPDFPLRILTLRLLW